MHYDMENQISVLSFRFDADVIHDLSVIVNFKSCDSDLFRMRFILRISVIMYAAALIPAVGIVINHAAEIHIWL